MPNPFDCGPGGVNSTSSASASSNVAPGFDPGAATCLLSCMFREDFANFAARCPSVNMCGRSLVGQCLHNLSLPHAQFDRADIRCCAFAFTNMPSASIEHARCDATLWAHAKSPSMRASFSNFSDAIAPHWQINSSIFTDCQMINALLEQSQLQDCDFSRSNMAFCNLSGCDMQRARFDECMMKASKMFNCNCLGCSFVGADLSSIRFHECILQNCVFANSSFAGTEFESCDILRCDFSGCSLSGRKWKNSVLKNEDRDQQQFKSNFNDPSTHSKPAISASLNQVPTPQAIFGRFDLCHSALNQTNFSSCTFQFVPFTGALMHGAIMTDCEFDSSCTFDGISCNGGNWQRVKASSCNFSDAAFVSAKMQNVSFLGANLMLAKFDSCDLQDAIFESAEMSDCTLTDCSLLRASCQRASMQRSRLSNCKLNDATMQRLMLARAVLKGCDLSSAVISLSIASHATFDGCIMRDCNFKGSIMMHAVFVSCDLSGSSMFECNFHSSLWSNCKALHLKADSSVWANSTMMDCDISGGSFNGSIWQGASLHSCTAATVSFLGANLAGITAQGSSFSKSFLCRSNLDRAVFISCALDACSMWSVSMTRTRIISCTLKCACLDLVQGSSAMITRCDAEECSARSCYLPRSNLAGTNWSGADLSASDLSGCLLHDCNMASTILYNASMDGCDISAAAIRWIDLWALCGEGSVPPPPLVSSAAAASEKMCASLPLQAIAAEADHIYSLALAAIENDVDIAAGASQDVNESTANLVSLTKSQAYAAAAEAELHSDAASADQERMLKAFPKEILDVVNSMIEAGQHGIRTQQLPTLMAIRCIGKAGKPILKGLDINSAYFFRCRLKNIDLRSCNLRAAAFIECDLTECKLEQACIDGLQLDGSLLHSTDLNWLDLLSKAREDVDADERISVSGCSFKPFKLPPDATVSRVNLSDCRINDAVVPNVRFQNVIFRGAQLVQGVFDGAVFSGCDISLAQLDGSSFVGTRYIGCTSESVSILDATVDWFKCRVCEKVFCNENNGPSQCRRHTDMFTGKGYWRCCNSTDADDPGCVSISHVSKGSKLSPAELQAA